MLLAFGFGVLLVVISGCWALRQRSVRQSRAVLLLADGLPTARVEAALQIFAWRWMVDYCFWYVYVPQYGSLAKTERTKLFELLSERLGFSLLSSGECQRLWQEKSCQFYFVSASGVFYRLNSQNSNDWERLRVL